MRLSLPCYLFLFLIIFSLSLFHYFSLFLSLFLSHLPISYLVDFRSKISLSLLLHFLLLFIIILCKLPLLLIKVYDEQSAIEGRRGERERKRKKEKKIAIIMLCPSIRKELHSKLKFENIRTLSD